MSNIASVLKAEIVRLSRKELRAQTDSLKKSLAAQRTEVAALKRRTADLEKALKAAVRSEGRGATEARRPAASPESAEDGKFRFRAQGMASNRKRLSLSAEDFGLLVGTTGQSVYSWESGKSKPRPRNLAAIAGLRGLGKREVTARLGKLKKSA